MNMGNKWEKWVFGIIIKIVLNWKIMIKYGMIGSEN